jgi:diaminohydroxyphosphoribosylaminopyrimidine deaminase/5-amino-6-(5-phosphoribosylamino)uracil reductase
VERLQGDEQLMARALALAGRGRGIVSPNPLVGAVVTDSGGSVVGEGWHEGPGTPHAEVVALDAAGSRARGGTLVVGLEPCNHFGRTPPCTEAILKAGIARVVAAMEDPNPGVAGGGIRRLREAGIEVSTGTGADAARRQNAPYLSHVLTGRPFVTLKLAATLDGKIAARDGSSTWITSEASRREVHRIRGDADAILVGAGTVIADDPRLTVRDPAYRGVPPLRVVADATGRVPPEGHVFDGSAPTVVTTTERAPEERREAWRSAGADVVVCGTDSEGGVDLGECLSHLGKRDVQSVLLEGGSTLAERAVRGGHVGRVILFYAPLLLGGTDAPSMLGGRGFATLAEGRRVEIVDVARIGPDVKVEADVHRDC